MKTKSNYFIRYKLIIEKIQRGGSVSYNEIESYLIEAFNMMGLDFSYSLRTFHRDKNDIYNIFGLRIIGHKRNKTYSFDEEQTSEPTNKLMDAFRISNALRLHDDLANVISFEKQTYGPQGVFYDLLDAVRNKNRIKLYYHKYHKETYDEYILEPLALKEFGQRWYLVASDPGGKRPRTFALDRIISIEILKESFQDMGFDLKAFFADYFGIMTDSSSKYSKVLLLFESLQGKYIKSMPLHASQKIISDDENGLKIELKLHITYDFLQKLFSYVSLVQVISPKFLRDKMKSEFEKAYALYS